MKIHIQVPFGELTVTFEVRSTMEIMLLSEQCELRI